MNDLERQIDEILNKAMAVTVAPEMGTDKTIAVYRLRYHREMRVHLLTLITKREKELLDRLAKLSFAELDKAIEAERNKLKETEL